MTDDPPLLNEFSSEMLQAIGILFVTASSAEQILALQMARLICHPNEIQPATIIALNRGELAVRMRQTQTLAYFVVPEPFRDECIELCDKIKEAFIRRNEFAHYICLPTNDPNQVTLMTAQLKGTKMQPPKNYNRLQILRFANRIHELTLQLDQCLASAGIRPLPESVPQDPAWQPR